MTNPGAAPRQRSKLVDLPAAAALVPDGARVAFGGQSVYQHPMAFVRQLVREGRTGLTVVGVLNGPEVDLLAGAGALAAVETSYVGLEQFGLARNYRRAVEQGTLQVEDYGEVVAFDRFRASESGWTFLPVASLAGSDVMAGHPKVKAFTCPITGVPLHAVPPAEPDVVVLHVGAADEYGNVLAPAARLVPQTFDAIMARSSDTVVVTAERIVSNAYVRAHPELTVVAGFRVAAVAWTPRGAHPCHCLGFYRLDEEHFAAYVEASRGADTFTAYLRRYVHDLPDENAYLDTIGLQRLTALETTTGVA